MTPTPSEQTQIHQIIHRDPVHIALAEIDRLGLRRQNLTTLQALLKEEQQNKNRPTLTERLNHLINQILNPNPNRYER